jgi:PAS domain S-box-containing protein
MLLIDSERQAKRRAVGIITIDENGFITDVDPAVEGLFGYKPEELIGENVKILMPAPYQSEHDTYLRNYRSTGQRKVIGIGREVVGQRKDKTVFPIDLAVSELSLGNGRVFMGLIRDISERKQIEIQRDLLVAELSHRVKNTLATVVAIAQQTFRQMPDAHAEAAFEGRLRALAKTHSRLADSHWAGASLRDVVMDEVAPHKNNSNIALDGPDVMLIPKQVLSLGMALHELVTNAVKYGALSIPTAKVRINWRVDDQKRVHVNWAESNGPTVLTPNRSGFGRLLLERGLAKELRGNVKLDFRQSGLNCAIDFPQEGTACHCSARESSS